MIVKQGENDYNNIYEGNNHFEKVQEFKYLGTRLNGQNNMHGEINIRLSTAN